MRRVFVTGAGGFLGSEIVWSLMRSGLSPIAQIHHRPLPFALAHEAVETYQFDLCDEDATRKALRASRPELLIHAAALARIDQCEADPARAQAVNVEATVKLLRIWGEECGGPICFFSTDLVFEGAGRGEASEGFTGFTPEDRPAPQTVYAQSKRKAEELFFSSPFLSSLEGLVIRVSLSYGPLRGVSGGFLRWMVQSLSEDRPVTLFTDEFRTPLCSLDLCRFIEKLCSDSSLLTGKSLIHAAGPNRLSRFEIGRSVARAFGFSRTRIDALVLPSTLAERRAELGFRAPDVSLSAKRFQSILGGELESFEQSLERLKPLNSYS